MSRHMDSSTTTQVAKSWSSMEDPVVPLERNLYGHPLAGLIWERQIEKVLLKHGWEKVPKCECLFVNKERRLFLFVSVVDRKNQLERNRTSTQCGKILIKDFHFGEKTSSLDHVYLGCTQWECQRSIDNYRSMFESKISAGATEKLPYSEKLGANISLWSYDMEGHAKKCVERYCELANKTTQQLCKVAIPCIEDYQFKQEENESVGELSTVGSKNCSEMSILARIGYQTIHGQWINLLVLPHNGPNLATNNFLVWSLTFITHVNIDNDVMWETLHNSVGMDYFKTLILQEISKTQNQHQEEFCAFSGVTRSCQHVGCARNKHLSHTVQRKLRLFLLMQVYAWMGFPLSIFGI